MSISEDQVKRFHDEGYLLIPDFIDGATADSLKTECRRLIDEMDPEEHKPVFNTLKEKSSVRILGSSETSDEYFINSGDRVRFFLEDGVKDEQGNLRVDKHLSINKMGHALCMHSEPFKKLTFSEKVQDVATRIGLVDPIVCQSMYIFKQPGIGGEVVPHQDSSILNTDPMTLVGFWIALEDCTLDNGCLWFIPKSHKNGIDGGRRFIRTPNRQEGDPATISIGEQVKYDPKDFIAGPVKKGTLVLIHGEVVHKSGKNLSSSSRHIYTFHMYDGSRSTWSPENWLQPTEAMPFPRLLKPYNM